MGYSGTLWNIWAAFTRADKTRPFWEMAAFVRRRGDASTLFKYNQIKSYAF